jgi:hypothetical protein
MARTPMNIFSDFPAAFPLRILAAMLAMLAGCSVNGQPETPEPRAEIQINLCASPHDVIQALPLRPDGEAPTEAWYFDTPELEFARRGLVFRLRQGDRQPELTLKLANQDCMDIKPAWIPRDEGKCEYDNHGAVFSGAVSLTNALDAESARALTAGRLPLENALSAAQIAYLRDVVAVWPLVSGILPLGPAHIRQYRAKKADFDVNVWALPAGETDIELSEKTSFRKVLGRRAELLAMLSKSGIALCPDQAGQGVKRLRILLERR